MRTHAHAPISMLVWLAALGLCAPLAVGALAQSTAPIPTQKSVTVHKLTHKRKVAAEARQPAAPVLPPAPTEPEKPNWPVNEAPQKAAVTWDSHGLHISAANSSLHQILEDYETATGSKIEGMGPDERIFGNYGPGEARDVLAQLFTGTGYNLVMFGDLGHGAPRHVVLSSRSAASSQSHSGYTPQPAPEDDTPDSDSSDDQQQGPPQPPQPQLQQPGAPADQAPRTPQQIMQEMQQRQQQLEQQDTQPQ